MLDTHRPLLLVAPSIFVSAHSSFYALHLRHLYARQSLFDGSLNEFFLDDIAKVAVTEIDLSRLEKKYGWMMRCHTGMTSNASRNRVNHILLVDHAYRQSPRAFWYRPPTTSSPPIITLLYPAAFRQPPHHLACTFASNPADRKSVV